jgi:magnesium chelatase family protein
LAIAVIACRAQIGLRAPPVEVEVSLAPGLPTFNVVGLPAMVVRESKERVRSALLHSGFSFPAGRITVNLSPADMPKRSGRFDLPIALGILVASGQLRIRTAEGASTEFYGELGLNGELKAVAGLLPAALQALQCGRDLLIPTASVPEVVPLLRSARNGGSIRAADHLLAVHAHLQGCQPLTPLEPVSEPPRSGVSAVPMFPDLSDVRGQLQAKRALLVAAAGSHSLLMVGPPGVGKSMLALRLAGLLPPLSDSEALEVASIAAVGGMQRTHFGVRPMRTPHHTISPAALIGGGINAMPGEISLAHHGVLFLDELLEYDRRALEALREPLESGVASIARASLRAQYPAQFQLVAAMNPCPCGQFGDPMGRCRCTPAELERYRARLSAPLLDRLDIQIEVPRLQADDFEQPPPGQSSPVLAQRVRDARDIQLGRQGVANSRLSEAQVEQLCAPDTYGAAILAQAVQRFGFSARSRQRVLRLARTIADLAGKSGVSATHVSEAITYRQPGRAHPDQR